MAHLSFRYRYDGTPQNILDDFGRLEMRVSTDGFSGAGGFWVQWQDVKEFGESLGTYPISADAPLSAQWGYNMQEEDDLILKVEIAAANARGDLRVGVEIADENNQPDRVRTSFNTNYTDLVSFRSELAQLMSGEIDEAVLTGR
ncbi:hypothetical protein WBQ88_12810 [Sphingopyxis sp. CCNWLW253]|uniref:hypothetical protein n=1 Tax=unclassified Sphingopyxis TaxID=2614943 RepID=UPI003012E30E